MTGDNPPKVRRRELLSTLAFGAAAAVTYTVQTEPAAADSESEMEKVKPRYQAHSPEVETFYRVNRYPSQ